MLVVSEDPSRISCGRGVCMGSSLTKEDLHTHKPCKPVLKLTNYTHSSTTSSQRLEYDDLGTLKGVRWERRGREGGSDGMAMCQNKVIKTLRIIKGLTVQRVTSLNLHSI